MKIIKYKKGSKGKYKLVLDNNREIVLYEDVILKYNLLLTKEIDDDLLIEIDRYNQECDVYYVALYSIQNRFKSISELRKWLLGKEYPIELVDKAIDKLIRQGYLNDEVFTKSYINNQMITTSKGPYRIKRELEDKGVDSNIINKEIDEFSEEQQISRIRKIIDKNIRSNHNKGGVILKQKIYNQLQSLGYDISLIHSIINEYSFHNSSDMIEKEYNKLKRKYSRKYEGEELERVIREKLYMRGLRYEEE